MLSSYYLFSKFQCRRIGLSGSFFYGVQFASFKRHLSLEPLGLLLDRLRDSCVWRVGGLPLCNASTVDFKSLDASQVSWCFRPQHSFSDSNFAFTSYSMGPFIILFLAACVCSCIGKSGQRRAHRVRVCRRNLGQPPTTFHLYVRDTYEISFWFHSHLLLSS